MTRRIVVDSFTCRGTDFVSDIAAGQWIGTNCRDARLPTAFPGCRDYRRQLPSGGDYSSHLGCRIECRVFRYPDAGEMDGLGLSQWIGEHRPDLKVILTSGFTKAAERAHELCIEGPLVAKPCDVAHVARPLQEAFGFSACGTAVGLHAKVIPDGDGVPPITAAKADDSYRAHTSR